MTTGRVQINGVVFTTTDVTDRQSGESLRDRLISGTGIQRFSIEPEPGKRADLLVDPARVWSVTAWVTP